MKTAPLHGKCEVILYSPNHAQTLPELPLSHVRKLVDLWCERFEALSRDPEIKYILIFENRGELVGVTMPHPHGQIYGYPWIPKKLALECASSAEHYAETGRCLYCDLLADERADGRRILFLKTPTLPCTCLLRGVRLRRVHRSQGARADPGPVFRRDEDRFGRSGARHGGHRRRAFCKAYALYDDHAPEPRSTAGITPRIFTSTSNSTRPCGARPKSSGAPRVRPARGPAATPPARRKRRRSCGQPIKGYWMHERRKPNEARTANRAISRPVSGEGAPFLLCPRPGKPHRGAH